MSQNRRRLYLVPVLLLAAGGLVSCAVGPNYKRPTVDVPVTFRGETAGSSPGAEAQSEVAKPKSPEGASEKQSLGDEKWWEVF